MMTTSVRQTVATLICLSCINGGCRISASGAQGAGVETKDYRCPGFPLDSPTGFLKHLEDIIAFHLAKGFDVLHFLFPGLTGSLEPVQYLQRGSLADDHRTLDDTLQLAHVAGPVVVLEGVQGLFHHGFDLSSYFLIEFGDKKIDKQRDVFLALPERRDRDGENVEPVEQVLPEPAIADLFLQVPVGGRDDPHIDLDGAGLPSRSNSPSWMTRSSLVCSSSGISPISSRNRVPPSANSKRPICRASEPVNAPFPGRRARFR